MRDACGKNLKFITWGFSWLVCNVGSRRFRLPRVYLSFQATGLDGRQRHRTDPIDGGRSPRPNPRAHKPHTEVYGMTDRQDVRDKLQLAVDFIVDNQNEEGGWRYVPKAVESDMSVHRVPAQRAARRAQRGHPRAARHDRRGARLPSRAATSPRTRGPTRRVLRRAQHLLHAAREGQLPLPGEQCHPQQHAQQLRAHGRRAGRAAQRRRVRPRAQGRGAPSPAKTLDLQASVDYLLDHVDLVSGKSPYTFHYFYW